MTGEIESCNFFGGLSWGQFILIGLIYITIIFVIAKLIQRKNG